MKTYESRPKSYVAKMPPKISQKYQNYDSYRLLRFGVGLFNDSFGVGYGVVDYSFEDCESDLESGWTIYPESESESRVA